MLGPNYYVEKTCELLMCACGVGQAEMTDSCNLGFVHRDEYPSVRSIWAVNCHCRSRPHAVLGLYKTLLPGSRQRDGMVHSSYLAYSTSPACSRDC